jgi:subtilisin family serine protease
MDYITLTVLTSADRARVADALTGAVVEGATVWGQLEDRGALNQVLSAGTLLRSFRDDQSPPAAFTTHRAQRATTGVRASPDSYSAVTPPPESSRGVFVVSLLGPLFRNWIEAMGEMNAYPLDHLGDDTYTVAAQDWTAEGSLRNARFVSDVRPYTRDDTIRLQDAPENLDQASPLAMIDVIFHRDAHIDRVQEWLSTQPGQVVTARHRSGFRALVRRDRAVLLALADNADIALIEEVRETEAANDHARAIVHLPQAGGTHRGAGQLVAVADTGIDDQHPDIHSRLRSRVDLAGRGSTADTNGHGTHVAASIAGEGVSDPAFTGMAPDCELHFQAITASDGSLKGVALLQTILDNAEAAGANIVNLSWVQVNGSGTYGIGRIVDEFVRAHPAILVVAAAGNQGTESIPPYGQIGHSAKRTVAPPSTAKNSLSIGASRSDITAVAATPMPQDWRTWFPGNGFRNSPIASDALSGDDECLDARSGRGPCASDERIKPDLVAPGTFICSAHANVGKAGEFWAQHANPDYAYHGGSSMATAIVSGCATVVRDWLVNDHKHTPSAALLRALLVNGSAKLSGWDAIQDGKETPNYHQGFGRVDVLEILPDSSRPDFCVNWLDMQGSGGWGLTALGEAVIVRFNLATGDPLRLCLTWDDPPGPAVVNPLELILTLESLDDPTESAGAWRSNVHAPGRLRSSDEADLWNNVHVIRVEDPPTGWYRARIQANSTPLDPPQGFALALSGRIIAIGHPLHQS